MEVKVADHEDFKKKVEIKVPYEELSDKINAKFQQYKKTIQLEGFRKGKVPLNLIKKVYGKQIEAEAIEDAIPEVLQKAIDQEKIKYFDIESVKDVNFNEENGLTFNAIVRVEPEIELTKYKGLKFEKRVYQVSDAEVEEALENLREQYATMDNVEDEAKEGHFIVADLQKTDESGHPLIGEKYDNRYLQLRTKEDDDEVTEQLLGIKPGETRQIKVQAPENAEGEADFDYFSVTVKEIKEKKLPELDDEFAKDVGEESLESLTKKVREQLEKQAADNDNNHFEEIVIDKLVKENPFELPDFIVDSYVDDVAKEIKSRNPQEGSEEDIKKEIRSEAIRNLRWWMIRDKISEMEDLKVEDKEIDDHIEEIAKKAGREAPKIRREYRTDKMRRQLRQELLHKKVIDAIINNSKVVEKIVTLEDLRKQAEIAETIAAD
ncbi:trigger factor [candidate division KSB1 bacterium 4484_87]|nr:MAG: trigger factor [candidate division KSB1 bacterium 4484_87]